jgi:hypothetical protein
MQSSTPVRLWLSHTGTFVGFADDVALWMSQNDIICGCRTVCMRDLQGRRVFRRRFCAYLILGDCMCWCLSTSVSECMSCCMCTISARNGSALGRGFTAFWYCLGYLVWCVHALLHLYKYCIRTKAFFLRVCTITVYLAFSFSKNAVLSKNVGVIRIHSLCGLL